MCWVMEMNINPTNTPLWYLYRVNRGKSLLIFTERCGVLGKLQRCQVDIRWWFVGDAASHQCCCVVRPRQVDIANHHTLLVYGVKGGIIL